MGRQESVIRKQIWQGDTKPAVNDLVKDFQSLEMGMDGWTDQSDRNADVRFARWRGQSRDFRKRQADAFPWKGASDIQEFAVDELCNEDTALLMTALWESDISALAHKPESAEDAYLAAQFMRWQMTQMTELDDEAELAANTMLQGGMFAVGVFWREETELEERDITLEQLAQFDNELFILVTDINTDDRAVDKFQLMFPRVSKAELNRAVRELREENETTLRIPVVVKSRAEIRTYIMGDDLLMPSETMDTDKLARFYTIDWLEPAEIRQRVIDDDWDKKWADRVIELGRGINTDRFVNDHRAHRLERRFGFGTLDQKIKVVTAYQRLSNDKGIPGWYFTIFSPTITNDKNGKEMVAKNELLNYKPSRHPLIIRPLERVGRRVLDSRGYGETGKSMQNQLKLEKDARIDNSSISTLPAMEYLAGRKPPDYGPGRKVPVRRRGEIGFVETPPTTAKSVEVENSIREDFRRRYGRPTNDGDPTRINAMNRRLVRRWLNNWQLIFNHVWQLFAQFGSETTYFQVLGPTAQKGMQSFKNKGEIFDFALRFDERKLDNDALLAKYKLLGEIAGQFDRNGEVNTSQFLRDVFSAIDPQIGERVLQPPEQAQQNEIADEMKMLTQIWSGMDVDLPETNINAQLRLQLMDAWMQGSPDIPAIDVQNRLRDDQAFQARVQKHRQKLEFIIVQQQNAVTGRQGAPAGNFQAQTQGQQLALT